MVKGDEKWTELLLGSVGEMITASSQTSIILIKKVFGACQMTKQLILLWLNSPPGTCHYFVLMSAKEKKLPPYLPSSFISYPYKTLQFVFIKLTYRPRSAKWLFF